MLILRSEIKGTRVVEIDELLARGARGPAGRPVIFLLDAKGAEVALHSPVFDRGRIHWAVPSQSNVGHSKNQCHATRGIRLRLRS